MKQGDEAPDVIPPPPGLDPAERDGNRREREVFTIRVRHEDGSEEKVKVVRHEAFARERSRFKSWRRRATAAFVLLTVVSTAAAYLGYDAGADADDADRRAARTSDINACTERVKGRIVIAVGFDELRRAAVGDSAEGRVLLVRTQPVIDRFLSNAVGRPVKLKTNVELSDPVTKPLQDEGIDACVAEADQTFKTTTTGALEGE